jgi:signal transduction histidine kinase
MLSKPLDKDILLIVDDAPANLSVLFDFLTVRNFKVLVAQDGKSALQKARCAHPDLILLDVMMPGMDGFETCRQLKADSQTQDIPIIFMTALADTESKIKGFELGAVDYVTKPFHQEEVFVRVRNHLTLRKLQKELQTQNDDLDAFAHTVAHDLKNPLSAVIGFADLLHDTCGSHPELECAQYLQELRQASHKMLDIIEALMLLAGASKQTVALQPLEMSDIVKQVRQRLNFMIKEYQGEILFPNHWPLALGYAPWVEEIWVNYVNNGLKYGGHPPKIELGATVQTGFIQFWVQDNGDGFNAEEQARLFTPFYRLNRNRAKGHGLGLSIVQRVVEKLGGKVGVESQIGKGSRFYFTLPSATH